MAVTIGGAARFALWVFVAFHVSAQVIWVVSEWWIKWDNLVDKSQANQNFCDDVCAIAKASKRYGDNVRQCTEICRPSYQLPVIAARATLENYHPCGLNTPCLQALFDFVSSTTGIMTVLLAIFVLPGMLRQIFCPIPSFGSTSPQINYRAVRRTPLTVEVVDDANYDYIPEPAALPAPPASSSWNFIPKLLGSSTSSEKIRTL